MSAADYSAKKSIVIITTTGSSNAVGNGVDDDAISKWRRDEGGVGGAGGVTVHETGQGTIGRINIMIIRYDNVRLTATTRGHL